MTDIAHKVHAIYEDDFLALGEDVNAEIVDGEIIIMSPTKIDHGIYGARLIIFLGGYLAARPLRRVISDQAAYITQENPDGSIRGALVPDVSYMSYERLPQDVPLNVVLRIAPEIAVEVISSGESSRQVIRKTQAYLEFGVLQVWLMFHQEEEIRVCTPEQPLGKVYSLDDSLPGGDVLPDFSLPLRAIFDLNDDALYAKTLRELVKP